MDTTPVSKPTLAEIAANTVRWLDGDYQVEPSVAAPTAREIAGIALIVLIGFVAIYAELAFVTGGGW